MSYQKYDILCNRKLEIMEAVGEFMFGSFALLFILNLAMILKKYTFSSMGIIVRRNY